MHSWWELIRLGVGGALGMWAEWWAAELMVFLGGLICSRRVLAGGDPEAACIEVAVTVLLRNFGNAAIGMSWGFSMAGTVRVGNLLGEGKARPARIAAIIGGTLQAVTCLIMASFLVLKVDVWAAWFNLQPDALALLNRLIYFGAGYWFGIALGCGALRSMLIALGLVRFAAVVQFVVRHCN